jgi:hypothetical protein
MYAHCVHGKATGFLCKGEKDEMNARNILSNVEIENDSFFGRKK